MLTLEGHNTSLGCSSLVAQTTFGRRGHPVNMKLLESASSAPAKGCDIMFYEFEGKLSMDKKTVGDSSFNEDLSSRQEDQQLTVLQTAAVVVVNTGSTSSSSFESTELHHDTTQDQAEANASEDIIVDDDDDVFSASSSSEKYPSPGQGDTSFSNYGSYTTDAEHDLLNRQRMEQLRGQPRRPRLLKRRILFATSRAMTESEYSDDSKDDVGQTTKEAVVVAAKEKLVNLTQEKLRSYSTDFHSNCDGLRNRVLVESALKKFLLHDLPLGNSPTSRSPSPPSPCNTPVKAHMAYRCPRTPATPPSTPRKRSISESCALTPSTPSAFNFDGSPSSSYDADEEGTSILSDSIKRMKLIHSSPVSRRCSRSFEQDHSPVIVDDSVSMEDSFIQG